ncbi:VOC family protein [Streptomyces beijiangensis]|uniref:VOC family protein n=1 Tax=Streptomyces beijiangensis TaxID=163361 RepID=A0A939FDW2_9ACTN|nr:VOC family protein [Streptomyces beijiangensis]MBO0515607.1 VOC family protein [Streptomyces beijiangensis]
MKELYHVGFAVPDIESAMSELADAVGAQWHEVRDAQLGEWAYRIVFSRGPGPRLELIQGPSGSPWDCGGSARFDHLGFWAESVEEENARMPAATADFDGCPYGRPFAYHRLEGIGGRVEFVDLSVREGFLSQWPE